MREKRELGRHRDRNREADTYSTVSPFLKALSQQVKTGGLNVDPWILCFTRCSTTQPPILFSWSPCMVSFCVLRSLAQLGFGLVDDVRYRCDYMVLIWELCPLVTFGSSQKQFGLSHLGEGIPGTHGWRLRMLTTALCSREPLKRSLRPPKIL